MHPLETPSLAQLREAIISVLPEFAQSQFTLLNEGWDSVGVDADDAWIFKFPRHEAAIARLRREVRILSMVRSHAEMPVPDMVLYESPMLFSRHRKLAGEHLLGHQYLKLNDKQRDAIAEKLAALYARLHAIPHAEARTAGAVAMDAWPAPAEVAACALNLPDSLRPFLQPTLDAFAAMAPDDMVYGYFDGHGWNMAFDHSAKVLNGVYDFADSGFGGRHQDLSYSNWISRDLTLRIIDRYERLTGLAIDRERVMLYSQMLRFVEVVGAGDDLPDRLAALHDWFNPGA